jgi:hypothetical protein
VTNRANAADARGYVGDFVPLPAPQHCFKEPGSLYYLPLAPFHIPVFDLDFNITVSFQSGYVVNLD